MEIIDYFSNKLMLYTVFCCYCFQWCEQDQRCNRLQLADLLIGPMQHCTKLPLLLHNIQKYTADMVEKTQIVESIEKVEMSLRKLYVLEFKHTQIFIKVMKLNKMCYTTPTYIKWNHNLLLKNLEAKYVIRFN